MSSLLFHFLSGKGECLAAADNEQLSVLEGFDRRCRFLSGNPLNALRHIGEGTGDTIVPFRGGQLYRINTRFGQRDAHLIAETLLLLLRRHAACLHERGKTVG